jgi:hypothetical protein
VSNPLLRPHDPRFQRPPLRDAAGNNVFADPDVPVPAEAADSGPLPARVVEPTGDNVFASPAPVEGSDPTYQPQYETTHAHRGILLLVLSIVGLVGDGTLLLFLAGTVFGLIGLLAIVPAVTAFLLARADLVGMRQGAIDPAGLAKTRLAMWLGLAGVVVYALALAATGLLAAIALLEFVQNG